MKIVNWQRSPLFDAKLVNQLLGTSKSSVGGPPLVKQAFITFFDPGLSIFQLHTLIESKKTLWELFKLHEEDDAAIFYSRKFYDYSREPVTVLEEPPRYRQLGIESVLSSNSTDPKIRQFRASLPHDQIMAAYGRGEKVPSPRVIVMGMVITFLATGSRLFANHLVSSDATDAEDHIVHVGDFQKEGLQICSERLAHRRFSENRRYAVCHEV